MKFILPALVLLIAAPAGFASSMAKTSGAASAEVEGGLGTIRGIVRDEGGGPIADATVAIFRVGTTQLLKQVSTAANGSFIAKVLPGTYSVLAVAQGFNPMSIGKVEVNRSADLNYGFQLERAGSGKTLPERKLDRNSSKWRIRAAQNQRSIFQNTDGDEPVTEADSSVDDKASVETARPQAVVESYFASGAGGSYQGVNFATLVPINPRTEIAISGQLGRGYSAPQRFETTLRYKANEAHALSFTTSIGQPGLMLGDRKIGQAAFQAVDEWKARNGFILVLGVDYAKLLGGGGDAALYPRIGVQFDADAKTRMRAGFTSQTEQRNWADVADLEGFDIAFRDPVSIDETVIEKGKAKINRSTRLEFGVERVLDNRSSIETNIFVDTTFARGVGLDRIGFDDLSGDGFDGLVANQQGRAAGVRVVYSRRLTGMLTASAGYAFGTGQKLSADGLSDPASVFQNAAFQSIFGELDASFDSGTNVRTIIRLSPDATVFAIDPFKGRLAIYDPGLSVLVTQRLPRFGLPVRAQAIIDARNIFDLQSGIQSADGVLGLDSQRRMLRGGIMLRF